VPAVAVKLNKNCFGFLKIKISRFNNLVKTYYLIFMLFLIDIINIKI
jgi:hypothetical protein